MRKGRKVKSCFAGTLLLLNVGISSVYAMDFPEKVLETLQCTEGEILVESEVIVPETPIHKGDVERVLFSLDNAKLLYGEEEDWIQSDEPGMWEVRGVPDQAKILAYLTDGGMGVCFELDASRLGKAEQRKVQEKEKRINSQEVAKLFGMEGKSFVRTDMDGFRTETILGCLDEVQIAFYSQVPFMATVQYINDCLEYCCFWGNYQISATEDVQLLSMDEIMDMADLYASCGMINPPETRDEIYEIEMQYYLEEMDGKVTFRPIWNFKVQQINPGGASPTGNGCDFFYLDAQDGTLVDYRGY